MLEGGELAIDLPLEEACDICAATGKKMVVTAEHDGRIIALVLWDLARKLKRDLRQRSVFLRLSGVAVGDFLFGAQPGPHCILAMDVFTFALRSSGRITASEMDGYIEVEGDRRTATWFLQNADVPY